MKLLVNILLFVFIFLSNFFVISLDHQSKYDKENFLHACKFCQSRQIEDLIDRNVDINCCDEECNTGLILLIKNLKNNKEIDCLNTINLLIRNNARINLMNISGKSALYYACNIEYTSSVSFIKKQIKVIELLLKNGADPITEGGVNVVFELLKRFIYGFFIPNLREIKSKFGISEKANKIIAEFENKFRNLNLNNYSDFENFWLAMKKFYFIDLKYEYCNYYNTTDIKAIDENLTDFGLSKLFDDLNFAYKKYEIKQITKSSLQPQLLSYLSDIVINYL